MTLIAEEFIINKKKSMLDFDTQHSRFGNRCQYPSDANRFLE